jgi:hypothetical protein
VVTLLMMSTAPSKSTQTAGLNLAGWPLFITRQKSANHINGNPGYPPPTPTDPKSDLIQINPDTGALIKDIGAITFNGAQLHIADLAIQPGTGVLFAISANSTGDFSAAGNLYTINKSTGVATLVGATGDFFGSIAFAPNGTLYMIAADLDNMGNIVNSVLKTINPANAKTLTMVPILNIPGALAVRSDGVIFEGNGDGFPDPLGSGLFTIDPKTGAETLVGHPGLNFVGDIDFRPPVPEPMTLTLCGLGLLIITAVRKGRQKIS